MSVEATTSQRKRKLAMNTFHHMPGQRALGDVAPHLSMRPVEPTGDYEYDPFEAGSFVGGWVGGVIGGELAPMVKRFYEQTLLPDAKYPWFGTKYGKTVRARTAVWTVNELAKIAQGPIENLVRAALHGVRPDLTGKPDPGLGFKFTPANKMAASLVKTVSTGVMKTWVTSALAPPPPPPPPPAPGVAATQAPLMGQSQQSATMPNPVQVAATGPTFLGKDLKQIGNDALSGTINIVISAAYDQTVGPIVQKSINRLFGKKDEPIRKPAPMTPGLFANAIAGSILSSLLLRPVSWPKPAGGEAGAQGAAAGYGSLLSTALVNGFISAAFDDVYGRGIGPSIENHVNRLAGIDAPERKPETYTGERLLRSLARSTVSGASYYMVDGATQPLFATLGGSIGGGLGAFVAMAGPALLGITAATVTDQVVGAKVGSLAGSVFSWLSGKPKSEHRPKVPEQPTPADKPATPGAPGAPTTAKAPLRRKSDAELAAEALAAAALQQAA